VSWTRLIFFAVPRLCGPPLPAVGVLSRRTCGHLPSLRAPVFSTPLHPVPRPGAASAPPAGAPQLIAPPAVAAPPRLQRCCCRAHCSGHGDRHAARGPWRTAVGAQTWGSAAPAAALRPVAAADGADRRHWGGLCTGATRAARARRRGCSGAAPPPPPPRAPHAARSGKGGGEEACGA